MKQRSWYSMIGSGVVCVLAMGLSSARAESRSVKEGVETRAPKLQGSWRTQITLRNCETGAALRPAFPAMMSVASGGSLTTADSGFSPAFRSPGHGAWQYTGGGTYSAIVEAFLFDASGAMSGTQRLRQVIEVADGGDEFAATVSAEVFDIYGNRMFKSCASSVGQRME